MSNSIGEMIDPCGTPQLEAPWGRNILTKLYSLGTVLQEGSEPGKCQATDSQLGEPLQEDTVVKVIEGG